MKSSLLRIFLEWALIASVLMSIGFFVWYWLESKGVHESQSQIAGANEQFQRSQTVMSNLKKDCDEYAKTHADFASLLNELEGRPAASALPKPAAR